MGLCSGQIEAGQHPGEGRKLRDMTEHDEIVATERRARLAALTCAAGAGDARATERLLVQLAPLVRSAARRAHHRAVRHGAGSTLDVDDLEQEARLALVELAAGYRPESGSALLYFLNRLPVRLRRRVRRVVRQQAPWLARASWGEVNGALDATSERLLAAAEGGAADDQSEALRAAFDRLALRDRRILYLRFWRQRTNAEVARALDISQPSAHRAVERALRHLRIELARLLPQERNDPPECYALPPRLSLPTRDRSAAGTATEPSACW